MSKPARPPPPPTTRSRVRGKSKDVIASSAAKPKTKDASSAKVLPKHAILSSSESDDSDLFPGDGPPSLGKEEPAKRSRAAKAKPKTGKTSNGSKKPESGTGGSRRINTTTYTSQVLVEDFVDCHLCDWISNCDPTWGARELWEQESKSKLLLEVAFCCGWLPKDTKISDDKQKVLDAASSQYTRRSRPLEVTAWGPSEVARYMRWQLHMHKQGKVKRGAIGGFGWKLPKKSEDGEPAPLPDEVVSFEKKRKSQDISQDSDDDNAEEAEDDGESVEPGSDAAEDEVEDYSVQGPTKKDKNWYLVQVATGKRVQLLESGPFTLYVHDGQSCIISALEDEGTFCAGHFPKKIKPAPKDEKKPSEPMVRGSDRLKPLKGMEAKGAGKNENDGDGGTKPKQPPDAEPDAEPENKVMKGFSDEENDGEKVTDSDEEPGLHILDDGRTVLVHLKENKQLVLPGKHEWKIESAHKHGDAILQCTTGNFSKRNVKHALQSSKTTAIGVEIPADQPASPPPKAKRSVSLKIASSASTTASPTVPPADAAVKEPADAPSAAPADEVVDAEGPEGEDASNLGEKPLTDDMDET